MLPSLKVRRLSIGLTRAELAARAELTSERVAILEEEHDDPSSTEIVKLAAALGATVRELRQDRQVAVAVRPVRVARPANGRRPTMP